MAVRELHSDDALRSEQVAVLITLDEGPEHPGITKRWTSVSSCVLMVAYIFRDRFGKPRCRHGWRVLSAAESKAYQAERMQLHLGDSI